MRGQTLEAFMARTKLNDLSQDLTLEEMKALTGGYCLPHAVLRQGASNRMNVGGIEGLGGTLRPRHQGVMAGNNVKLAPDSM